MMKNKWIYIVFSLMMVCGLGTSCGALRSTPAPSSSTHSADISGKVTIADKVKCLTFIPVSPSNQADVFWIMQISVRNISYPNAVIADFQEGYKGWEIVANGQTYRPVWCGGRTERMSLGLGQSGNFMLYFEVPGALDVSDAQISYQGQEPYSYGKLTAIDRVAAYDWDLKKIIPTTELYVITEMMEKDRYVELTTVEAWRGSSSKTMKFSLDKAPAVVNYGSTQTSSIGKTFRVSVIAEVTAPQEIAELNTWKNWLAVIGAQVWEEGGKTFVSWSGFRAIEGPLAGVGSIQIMEVGTVTIDVSASGCDWWVKVGVE